MAVLLGADDYDALQETIAVFTDAELVRDHLEGLKAMIQGEAACQDELADAMRAAGRLSAPG